MSGRSGGRDAEGEWEVRPGGMLVQRRDGEAAGPVIRIRVSHGASFREVLVPAQATFGTLGIHPCSFTDLFSLLSHISIGGEAEKELSFGS